MNLKSKKFGTYMIKSEKYSFEHESIWVMLYIEIRIPYPVHIIHDDLDIRP